MRTHVGTIALAVSLALYLLCACAPSIEAVEPSIGQRISSLESRIGAARASGELSDGEAVKLASSLKAIREDFIWAEKERKLTEIRRANLMQRLDALALDLQVYSGNEIRGVKSQEPKTPPLAKPSERPRLFKRIQPLRERIDAGSADGSLVPAEIEELLETLVAIRADIDIGGPLTAERVGDLDARFDSLSSRIKALAANEVRQKARRSFTAPAPPAEDPQR